MSSVEVLVLLPLLVTILVLNAVLIDSLRGELEEVEKLSRELQVPLSNSTYRVNGSLLP